MELAAVVENILLKYSSGEAVTVPMLNRARRMQYGTIIVSGNDI